jgi:hydrogenase nickel incorporation protein HypA/HybF
MHEFSIVQSLLDQCEDQVVKNEVSKITKVVVKIGVLSGVEPDLLKSAFETFKEKTVCSEAEFVLNIQPILVKCNSCNAKSTLEKFEYICPKCKSSDLEVLDGEDMYLMSLEME